MLKYCSGCERDLEIDNFYSYNKSTCKESVNKKVKCYHCGKEFNSTNLSKHIKQRHSTHDSTRTNDSTSDRSLHNDSTSISSTKKDSTSKRSLNNDSTSISSRKKDSTSNRSPNNDSTSNSKSEQIDDSTYYNLSDSKNINDFIDTRKNIISNDKKDIPKINSLLDKSRLFNDKLYEKTITQKEKRQYITTTKKLKNLKYFNKEVSDIIIKAFN